MMMLGEMGKNGKKEQPLDVAVLLLCPAIAYSYDLVRVKNSTRDYSIVDKNA